MKIKEFILNSKNIEKDGFLWNMVACVLMAFQSVIMLMVLTRTVGLIASGIYTIAYANANLFLNIGKFGMRNYQVSDVTNEYEFEYYRVSRIYTVLVMISVSILYVVIVSKSQNYTIYKSLTIIWMCLFKVIDALEDVYHGLYQKSGRLDIGAKAISIRLIATLLLFSMLVILSGDLLLSLIVSTVFSFMLYKVVLNWTYEIFKKSRPIKLQRAKMTRLFIECFPLFLGSFLSYYIGNAPKYAIDAQLTDELQACYGFIAMPVFVVGLLNSFIFNPLLYHISKLWVEGDKREFIKKILRQVVIITAITIICILAAAAVGIPVLSILYNVDLSGYKTELLILLLGGGFLGLSGLLNSALTIMRRQKLIVCGYGITAGLAVLFSGIIVRKSGVFGASVLYLILMAILCMLFTVFLGYGCIRGKR